MENINVPQNIIGRGPDGESMPYVDSDMVNRTPVRYVPERDRAAIIPSAGTALSPDDAARAAVLAMTPDAPVAPRAKGAAKVAALIAQGRAAAKGRTVRTAAKPAARGKAAKKRKDRPSESELAAMSAVAADREREQYPATCKALAQFEKSTDRRNAAIGAAKYYGHGTVDGLSLPLWRVRFQSQRAAVAAMYRIPDDKKNKDALTAKVSLVVRLRDEGYKVLNILPPAKQTDRGRPKVTAVDKALTAAKRALGSMEPAERTAFVKGIAHIVKALSAKVAA